MSDSHPDYAAEIPNTRYAKEIATHFNQDHINRVTRVIEEIGAKEWLEENPLSRLELTRKVLDDDNIEVNGLYSFKDRTMQVATERSTSEYHKTFEWQRVYSVSSTGETSIEAIQKTLVHELGHHIHNVLRSIDAEAYQKTFRVNYLAGGTQYAQISHREFFAETFALYVFFRDHLFERDSNGHGMMQLALKWVGLEVHPL